MPPRLEESVLFNIPGRWVDDDLPSPELFPLVSSSLSESHVLFNESSALALSSLLLSSSAPPDLFDRERFNRRRSVKNDMERLQMPPGACNTFAPAADFASSVCSERKTQYGIITLRGISSSVTNENHFCWT